MWNRRTATTLAFLAIAAGPIQAQVRRSPRQVETRAGLVAPGDIWMESRTVRADDGTEVMVDFGRLVVPENRDRSDTNPIQLAFARLKGPQPAVGEPVFYLAGGPGDGAVWQASNADELVRWLPMLADRDVVFLDQRGAGESTPSLRWRPRGLPPFDVLSDRAAMERHMVDVAQRARTALTEAGHDLSGYTTLESTSDIDALRSALGYERISLLGFSYGTHLAIAYAREHADRLVGMVLSGVEGPDHTIKLPIHMDTQFRKLSLLVARDPELGPRIPDLVQLLRRVQGRLDDHPMVVPLVNPATGDTIEVAVASHFLDYIIRRDIGDARDIPVFPRLLSSIDQGDPGILRWFVQRRVGAIMGANAMSAVMDVASGATAGRLSQISLQATGSLFGGAANFPMPLWNEHWRAPDLGDDYRAPLVSDVRTLLLSGDLDWNTPPFQAEELKWGLTDATHLVVSNAGHEQVLPHPEIWKAVGDFLRGEDVSGVRAARPPLRFVPLEGYDPERWHPSLPRNDGSDP